MVEHKKNVLGDKMQKLLIGISGKMGTGKSTITNLLIEALGSDRAQRVSLAAPIYEAQDLIYDKYKLQMEGEKDRDLLIALGLWGRNKHPDFWLGQLARIIMESDREIIICDDVRFENEADFFNKRGFLFRIEGEQRGDNVDSKRKDDPTETSLDSYKFEHILDNTKSPADICKQIANVLMGNSGE
jgi:hypothetical protein